MDRYKVGVWQINDEELAVANEIPLDANRVYFDNTNTNYVSNNAQNAVIEAGSGSQLKNCKNKVYVCKAGNDTTGNGSHHNSYLTIKKAVDSITDSSENNIYLVEVGPGIFVEDEIVMPEYVSLMGSTIQKTIIRSDGGNHDCIRVSQNNEISFVTIQDAPTDYAGINADDCGSYAQIHKVSIYNCCIGLHISAETIDSEIYLEYVEFADCRESIHILGNSGFSAYCQIENGFFYLEEIITAVTQVLLEGPDADLLFLSGAITGNGESTAISILNGSHLSINSCFLDGYKNGVYIPNTGDAPIIHITNTNFQGPDNGGTELAINVLHTTAIGSIQGVMGRLKIVNMSSDTLQLAYQDPYAGDFNITRSLLTRGFGTGITEITAATQTTQILSTDAFGYVIVGTVSGQIIKLPDATTLREGQHYWVINATSTQVTCKDYDDGYVFILNSNSSAWMILKDKSTSAGVWYRAVASSSTFSGTAPVVCGYGGQANSGRYLEFIGGNPSNDSPFQIITASLLTGVSVSNGGGNVTAAISVYKTSDLVNPLLTLSLTNESSKYSAGYNITLSEGDALAVKVSSGAFNKPFATIYISGQ